MPTTNYLQTILKTRSNTSCVSAIVLDTTAPTGSIIINSGDTYTNYTSVTLTLNYSGATSGIDKVRYTNAFEWGSEPWETPVASQAWTLTSGDGAKYVSYQIMDTDGLISETYWDTIVLDTTPPGTPAPDDGVSGWSNDSTPTFTWTGVSDSGSGVSGYYWRIDSGSEVWTADTSVTVPFMSDGPHTFDVYAVENVGNFGYTGESSFQIDTVINCKE